MCRWRHIVCGCCPGGLLMSRWLARTCGVFLVGALVATAWIAYACSCVPPMSPQREFADNELVFAGRVMSIDGGGCSRTNVANFLVDEAFKGTHLGARIEIRMDDSSTQSCGLAGRIDSGERWLIFAGADRQVDFCSPMLA